MKRIALCLFILLYATPSWAQAVVGTVVGKNSSGGIDTLARATVQWVGTNVGVYANSQGTFSILRTSASDTLEFRMAGFISIRMVHPLDTVFVQMEPVVADVVTIQDERSSISSSPFKTEVISSKGLTRAACCSLAESFEKSPTVEVSYSDAVSGARQIQLLGLRGVYTQFLTEAVPAVRGMEIPYGLDHIPGPFMESVSISKGAASVTNGYEAMTGQINVEYRKPQTSDPLFVNAYANTMGRTELNVIGGGFVTDELSTLLAVHGRLYNTPVDQNGDGFLDVPLFRQGNVLNRWFFSDDKIEWQLVARAVVDDYASGQQGAGFSDAVPDSSRYAIRTTVNRYDAFAKFGVLNVIEGMEGSSIGISVLGVYHNMRSFFGVRNYDGAQRTVQSRLILALPFSEVVSIMSGLSYLHDDVRETLTTNSLARVESVPGAFAEATFHPTSNLTTIVGFRGDYHNLFGWFWTPRLHAKYSISDLTTIRASVGRGYRVATVVAENISAFINARTITLQQNYLPERSWNYGVSLTTSWELFGRTWQFDAEFYRTDFTDQIVPDFDQSPNEIIIRNMAGASHALSAMAQILVSPVEHMNVMVAYRWIDAQQTTGGVMQLRPMVSRYRVLSTLSWNTTDDSWQVDATISYSGAGRLPVNRDGPTSFPGFWRVNGQVTHRFDAFDVYVGVENLTDFYQQDPIVAPRDPFGKNFDASLTWGPMDPRSFYMGVRWHL